MALPWCPELSDHRPLSFSRKVTTRDPSRLLPLGPEVARMPEWVDLTKQNFETLCRRDARGGLPLRRLQLLKRAMRIAAEELQAARATATEDAIEDRLGWTLRFLRAAEAIRLNAMERCAKAYPVLRTLADPANPLLREGAGLEAVRAHAVALTRDQVLQELRATHDPGSRCSATGFPVSSRAS